MEGKFEIYQSGNSFFSNKKEAIELASKSQLGEFKEGKVTYSIYEAMYLLEKNKVKIIDNKNKSMSVKTLGKKLGKNKKSYLVFKDLRDKGHIVKEGLKFGSDFRVYEKGDRPGKSHAKYLLYAVEGREKLNLRDFCAKARVAHTTNKILLLAVIDSEGDISYYNINWKNN
jgi:tRNA-intron endonuclease